MTPQAIRWDRGKLSILDQTRLPAAAAYLELDSVEAVFDAIRSLKVRGAPAIGVCAAFGVAVGLRTAQAGSAAAALAAVHAACGRLAASRPTAVNLFWALDRMRAAAERAAGEGGGAAAVAAAIEAEACAIRDEDEATCRAIGAHGAALVREGMGVLTHCNAGALATAGMGTALAVLYAAHAQGRRFRVYADETRPLLQGARLTAWELCEAGIDTTLICDGMAAQVMREGRVQLVIVGADRIAANGDTANKIGTYGVALLARAHEIPFYVAAPWSTFDFALRDGSGIPIEQRAAEEVSEGFGMRTAPCGVRVYNPAFDVTPAGLVAGFITESGIVRPPFVQAHAAAAPAAAALR